MERRVLDRRHALLAPLRQCPLRPPGARRDPGRAAASARGVHELAAPAAGPRRRGPSAARQGAGAAAGRAGVISMADSFVAGPGEGYYGFGGRHGSVNKHGEKLYGWTEQESFGGEPTLRGGVALLPT